MSQKLKRKDMLKLLQAENEKIMDMLITHNVPDTIETDYEEFLLNSNKKATIKNNTASVDELQDRLDMIKNKLKTKKRPISERAQKKREAKKLKKNKEFKKVLVSATKSIKNENQKQMNTEESVPFEDKKHISAKPVFNEEGKMVFSKFDFAPHPGANVKKSHQNPREILKKIKETGKKINELNEKGEVEKAAEMRNEIAWNKAFDKVEGKKVKDDPKLLYKAIKKRKVEKKKSKKEWVDRKQKMESGIEHRQKKRQENIDKRIKNKKNKKLKNLSKKGRIIPGF
ncbi:surfeit locus protein 6 homolog [Teleopsis dalmanni]|uniref:surfeit locus protein 6 homolog n=1 Tax=Teleopsis dalmanni TaxID=139649 RepID=UPI0018CEFDB3|nr:surfeit locus protein 6 homolog [Teleopsis dalmanni]